MIRAIVLWLVLALPAWAQEGPVPAGWGVAATRAEAVLADDRAGRDTLEALRAELVDWRARFIEAETLNSARIATLREEIAALGPAPEEGGTEEPELAARRAELEETLESLLVPVREAQAAFAAASGLVAQTDAAIEERRAEALLMRDTTPLNPVGWPSAVAALTTWMQGLGQELTTPFRSAAARDAWLSRGVEIGFLALMAVILVWRSGIWLARLRDRVSPHEATSPAARLAIAAIGLGRALLPVAGLWAIVRIWGLLGASGPRSDQAAWLLPALGAVILLARWLGQNAFPPRADAPTLLPLAMDRRSEGRFHAGLLGVAMAGAILIEALTAVVPDIADARGVWMFALLVVAGITLVRMGQLLLAAGRVVVPEGEEAGLRAQLLRLLGRALMVAGAAGPLLAAVGYVNLGAAILWPAILSLALMALISVLQSVVFDLFAVATGRRDPAHDALAPTLIGIGLAVAALPVFALIWGVRQATLSEWWGIFLRGFPVGQARVSPGSFLTFVAVFVLGYMLVRLLQGVLRGSVLPKTKLDSGGTNAILSGTGYVGITLAALLAITTAGIDLSGLAIVAGALSVGIGFGLQTIVQNFVSGIILLIERPIKLGDWVNVGGIEGFVRQISVRSTRIETFDRQDVIVPNADLISGVVTNYTLGNSAGRVVLNVGVAYGTDTRAVEAVLQEVAEAHPMVVLNPGPLVTFDGFGADSLDFTIRVVIRDILFKPIVASEINHAIAARFTQEGYEIPFAQRDLWLRNPEALRPNPNPETP